MVLKNGNDSDVSFVINGIKEICKIEKQKPESNAGLLKAVKEAIKGGRLIVARLGNNRVGFVQFIFSTREPYGLDYGKRKKFCWIEWMYVTRFYRRHGVGRYMHQKIVALCKKKNVGEIMLDVFRVNRSAISFYRKENFKSFIHILVGKV
ncbi:MAG: GNAT family N-acetyltransferase [Nanoarchaeota archaeon]|nr:GNAT family N-acetyltransferase [Nanoarchaeota archaeon]MBU0978012.1 GNAT family N-acetyltransferase [Nanoarchaeota archaeon]